MYSVVIIDDEKKSRQVLKTMLQEWCPGVEIAGEADGVAGAVSLIEEKRPDAVFLDMQMGDGLGFDVIQHFPDPTFSVIFTTGYKEYAADAFKYDAIDYLLKPINPEELVRAVEKLSARDSSVDQNLVDLIKNIKDPKERKISLPTSNGWTYWKLGEIVHLEGSDNMTFFYNFRGERILAAKTLRYYEERLPIDHFYRCHKSHVISKAYVKEVVKKDGEHVAVLEDTSRIPVSRRRLKRFLEWLDEDNL